MKIKASNIVLLCMGIMIAGFSFLVYALMHGIGNANMVRSSLMDALFGIGALTFIHWRIKRQSLDFIVFETRNNSEKTNEE